MTYKPAKSTKWRIRIYVLVESNTGYVYSALPYYGSITSESLIRPDLPVSSRIPLDLHRKLLDNVPNAKGYHMYTDRNYTSIPLAEELLKMNCFLTGTIKTNRKYLPMTTICKRQENRSLQKTQNPSSRMEGQKRIVTLLSTCNEAGLISVHRRVRGGELVRIQKPKMVIDYIKNMRGADRAGQYAATYCFWKKSMKWWIKLFFWGMEMCTIMLAVSKQRKAKTYGSLTLLPYCLRIVIIIRTHLKRECGFTIIVVYNRHSGGANSVVDLMYVGSAPVSISAFPEVDGCCCSCRDFAMVRGKAPDLEYIVYPLAESQIAHIFLSIKLIKVIPGFKEGLDSQLKMLAAFEVLMTSFVAIWNFGGKSEIMRSCPQRGQFDNGTEDSWIHSDPLNDILSILDWH
uniref:DDE_Tnp_1_7 domain-containing protein n=1 Tax=Glossina pallidipes TaxID=7398 RepID=A0A1A9ZC50_GLOPL